MTTTRIILVAGATGKQGGAAIRHLLSAGRVRVLALTRNPESDEAILLASRGVEIAQGEFGSKRTLAAALAGFSDAFSVRREALEARHGMAFADAIEAAGTPHLVYSSLDGSDRASSVSQHDSKWGIEQHIRKLGPAAACPRVLLRLLPKDFSSMLHWFAEHGFQADIAALRREHSQLASFLSWLEATRRGLQINQTISRA